MRKKKISLELILFQIIFIRIFFQVVGVLECKEIGYHGQ